MIRHHSLRAALLAGSLSALATAAPAAEVTPQRLANPEPQNWLMNHRTYDGQRFSPLERINKDNVKNLRLAYAVALGGSSVNENLESTPLAEDGFLYIVDQWGILYKIDGRSGDTGRIIWRMDPKQEKLPSSNRGAALSGNFVISAASYPARLIATDKETGKVAWETNVSDGQVDLSITAAPLPVKDKIIVGAAGGDRGVRDFIAALDGKTAQADSLAQIRDPGAGRAGQRDLEGQEPGRLADRWRRDVGHRHLRSHLEPGDLGHRQPGPDVRPDPIGPATTSTPTARSRVWDADSGKDELVNFPIHARRHVGLR